MGREIRPARAPSQSDRALYVEQPVPAIANASRSGCRLHLALRMANRVPARRDDQQTQRAVQRSGRRMRACWNACTAIHRRLTATNDSAGMPTAAPRSRHERAHDRSTGCVAERRRHVDLGIGWWSRWSAPTAGRSRGSGDDASSRRDRQIDADHDPRRRRQVARTRRGPSLRRHACLGGQARSGWRPSSPATNRGRSRRGRAACARRTSCTGSALPRCNHPGDMSG